MHRTRCAGCSSLFIAAGDVRRCPGCGKKGKMQSLDFPNGGPTAEQVAYIQINVQNQHPTPPGSRMAAVLLIVTGALAAISGSWGLFWATLFADFAFFAVWPLWAPAAANILGAICCFVGAAHRFAGRRSMTAVGGPALVLLAPLFYFGAGPFGWWIMLFFGGGVLAMLAWIGAAVSLALLKAGPSVDAHASHAQPLVAAPVGAIDVKAQ